MIVADRHELAFCTRNDSRYQRDIRKEGSGLITGKLIIGSRFYA
jgi:hypothetical protein